MKVGGSPRGANLLIAVPAEPVAAPAGGGIASPSHASMQFLFLPSHPPLPSHGNLYIYTAFPNSDCLTELLH